MWFRNLLVYSLTEPFQHSAETLEAPIAAHAFRSCGSLEPFSFGWSPPLGDAEKPLLHAANGCLMLCARREDKVLPPAVINEMLEDKAAQLEAEQGRDLSRKERTRLRDEIYVDLLPRAFTRSTRHYAYIDPREGWVVVDAASPGKAEDLLTLLRKSLGTLPVKPLEVQDSPAVVMTDWLADRKIPGDFALQDECELRDQGEDGNVIRCRGQDLTGEEIEAHLQAGKQVVRLAVEWEDRLSCLITDQPAVKRLRFSDLVLEEAADAGDEDAAAHFDADFMLMTLELRRFLPRLVEVFGGIRGA